MPFSLYLNYITSGSLLSDFSECYIEISNIPGTIETTTFESIGSIVNTDGTKPIIKFYIKKTSSSNYEYFAQFVINQLEIYANAHNTTPYFNFSYLTFRETYSTNSVPTRTSGFTKSFDLYSHTLIQRLVATGSVTPISSPQFVSNTSGWTILNNPTYGLTVEQSAGVMDYENNGVWEINLPWEINYAGYLHNRAWVGTRGSISFENRTYRFSPSNPTSNSNSNTIFIAGSSSSLSLYNCTRVQYITLGSSPNRRFVIRYIGQLKYDSVNQPTVYDFSWEIVFYENDRTKFDIIVDPYGGVGSFSINQCYARNFLIYAELPLISQSVITGTTINRSRITCDGLRTQPSTINPIPTYFSGTVKRNVAYNYVEQRPITSQNGQQLFYTSGSFLIENAPPT